MQKIVVASDSFKGCLSSLEVAAAVETAVHQVLPHCEVVKVNVADGGEGTVDAVVNALGGKMQSAIVQDPLGRPIQAQYGLIEVGGAQTAIIEMSAASGLPQLTKNERNPLITSTYGTGELIMDAIQKGCRKFLIGIGGSATNDAGTGMLSALGFVFRNAHGDMLKSSGVSLKDIVEIDDSNVPITVRDAEFVVACDVDTPFCGPNGAAYVFAPQKGATSDVVDLLDEGMYSFAKVIEEVYATDIIPVQGAGAAGGLGGAFKVFLNAKLTKGIDMVLDVIGFDKIITDSDLIITGEGCIDHQTVKGKTAAGVLKQANRKNIPVIAIGGKIELCPELQSMGFTDMRSINEPNTPIELAMQKEFATERIVETITKALKTYCVK